ncbi:MAG: phage portal protein [Bdellovibrionales bacterium]
MFLEPRSATPRYENAHDALSNEDAVFFRSVGRKTNAGVSVNTSNAMSLPAVYCAVGILADALAMLPVDVYKPDGKGGKSKVDKHPAAEVMNRRANDYMQPFTARQTGQHHACLWGNGYFEIQRNDLGQPVGLWPLLPDSTWAVKPDKGDLYYTTTINGSSFKLPVDDVLHIKALGYDGYVGYSPVTVLREVLGLGIGMQVYASKFFGNDSKSGGFVYHPGKLSETGVKNLADHVNDQGGIDNAHRIKVLEEGVKFIQTTIPPEDAQFLQSREFSVTDIARIFRVPPALLAAMEKSTSWGSGIEQMMIAFLQFSIMPWVVRWEQEASAKLLTEEEKKKGYYIKLNVNSLLRGDMAARAEFYNKAINNGWMTRNEAREKEDMNPLPGLDEPLTPLNMVAGDTTADRPAPESDPEDANDEN